MPAQSDIRANESLQRAAQCDAPVMTESAAVVLGVLGLLCILVISLLSTVPPRK